MMLLMLTTQYKATIKDAGIEAQKLIPLIALATGKDGCQVA
jgi:hypothetical protein